MPTGPAVFLDSFICIIYNGVEFGCGPGDGLGTTFYYGPNAGFNLKFSKENFGILMYNIITNRSYNPLPSRTITFTPSSEANACISDHCDPVEPMTRTFDPSITGSTGCYNFQFENLQGDTDGVTCTGETEEGGPFTTSTQIGFLLSEALDVSIAVADGADWASSTYIWLTYNLSLGGSVVMFSGGPGVPECSGFGGIFAMGTCDESACADYGGSCDSYETGSEIFLSDPTAGWNSESGITFCLTSEACPDEKANGCTFSVSGF